jgi:acetylornithine deacetylase/succinyl-diaminopimelate desuccinylase-like protein
VILECCNHGLYAAGRGAVWYRFDLVRRDLSQLEMAAFVIEQLEKEGRAIRAESRHALFPQRPAHTCHGMIDRWGEHPSRICGHVAFRIDFAKDPGPGAETLIRDCLTAGLAEYLGLYGDKTKVRDSAGGRAQVDHHYDFRRDGNGFLVEVHGATGHMGAILEKDGAITKMAALVRALVLSRDRLQALAGSPAILELESRQNRESLKLEGGQGFVPTHSIQQITQRMTRAAERGAETYLRTVGQSGRGGEAVRGSYDKMHNAAYDGDPDSPAMRSAIAAACAGGLRKEGQPVTGWTVSCDARLFALECPGKCVITTGAGKLEHAHGDGEQIALDELVQSVEFLVRYVLRETGTGRSEP